MMSRDTAPGLDGIPYAFLRHLPEEGVSRLTEIFKVILVPGNIPTDWENYLLLPFLKPGKDPDAAASYRPIAQSSCLLKVFERVWKARLEWWAEAQDLLDPLQSGFRKGRNTSDVFGPLVCNILEGFAARQYTAVVFTDVAEAYDSVQPPLLLHRPHSVGVPSRVVRLLASLLPHRKIYATYNGRLIGPRQTSVGLAQGSVLSPLLYLLYTNHLSRHLPEGVISLKFADDDISRPWPIPARGTPPSTTCPLGDGGSP